MMRLIPEPEKVTAKRKKINMTKEVVEQLEKIDWQAIKVISFDLDDTLWDNSGVIERCEKETYEFLCEKHPPFAEHYSQEALLRISEQLLAEDAPHFDNMTTLRKAVLKHALIETAGDLNLVNQAFAIFYYWRNQVTIPNITYKLLQQLSKKYSLFAVSNGNSNLYWLGLMQYFEKHYIAGVDGRAKPSAEMLHRICKLKGIEPKQLLHIGDSHETDIQSSINAKCQHLHIDYTNIDYLNTKLS